MMTIHAAKGLEFPTVFIVGLEENIFPSQKSTESPRELEEERRLMYVAITRAEKHCILTCAQNRWRYGHLEFGSPSRFIHDIDPRLITTMEEEGGSYQSPPTPLTRTFEGSVSADKPNRQPGEARFKPLAEATATQSSSPTPSSDTTAAPLKAGDIIEHQRFGIGTVLKVEGTGENTKATVEFRNTGTKQLLLKFAKYTKL